MKKCLLFLLVLVFLFSQGSAAALAEVILISNKSVSASSLSENDVQDIFLGKTAKWPDGSKIHFVTLKGDVHKDFLKQYIKRTESQYNTYWKKMLFTGKGNRPKEFDSEKEMIDWVASTEGAIGYVSKSTGAGSAKVISVN